MSKWLLMSYMDCFDEHSPARQPQKNSPIVSKTIDHGTLAVESLTAARRDGLMGVARNDTLFDSGFFIKESAATSSPLDGAQLCKPELTNTVKEIMEHVDMYGCVLAALTSSLLSDAMNSEFQVVDHIHGSGLAKAFLDMIMGVKEGRSTLPTVPQLIMAIPCRHCH